MSLAGGWRFERQALLHDCALFFSKYLKSVTVKTNPAKRDLLAYSRPQKEQAPHTKRGLVQKHAQKIARSWDNRKTPRGKKGKGKE